MTEPKAATDQIPAPAFRTSSIGVVRPMFIILRSSFSRMVFLRVKARKFAGSLCLFLAVCLVRGKAK